MIRFINEQIIAGETYIRFPELEFSGAIDPARLRIAFKGKIIKGYNIIPESQARYPGKYRVNFHNGYVEEMVFPSFLYADNDPPVVFIIYSPIDDMTEVYFRKSDLENYGLLLQEKDTYPEDVQRFFTDAFKLWEVVLKSRPGDEKVIKNKIISSITGTPLETMRKYLNEKEVRNYLAKGGKRDLVMKIVDFYCRENGIPLPGAKRKIYNTLKEYAMSRHGTDMAE